ncbi:hypothetical protein HAX54_042308 [Datura stramonium]|uniref:Uncharacterized protein n=1 Tax=Datura stramonium TaxID=4076 RepID=A0ABS8W403_DATST|nr:hypothetical protein [Datura stramonium]
MWPTIHVLNSAVVLCQNLLSFKKSSSGFVRKNSIAEDSNGTIGESEDNMLEDPSELVPGRGLVKSARDMVFGREEDDMLYEDRIFQYASFNSAKFLAVLIIVPWALDFVVHDYVLMPFLDRYVKDCTFNL